MEKRIASVNISAAGGTAAKGGRTCKLTLPTAWVDALGISEDDREIQLSFDGARILIQRRETCQNFLSRRRGMGHEVRLLRLFEGDTLCSVIAADFSEKDLVAEDHVTDPVKTAFGRNDTPTWSDFLVFLEERCIPRRRGGLEAYLETIGVAEYDPIAILKKTKGRMAEDEQWLEVEEET